MNLNKDRYAFYKKAIKKANKEFAYSLEKGKPKYKGLSLMDLYYIDTKLTDIQIWELIDSKLFLRNEFYFTPVFVNIPEYHALNNCFLK